MTSRLIPYARDISALLQAHYCSNCAVPGPYNERCTYHTDDDLITQCPVQKAIEGLE